MAEIPIRLGLPLSATLRETSCQCGSTVVMAVLTAYLATTLIWSGESIITSGFFVTGRDLPGLERTIGWFGSLLFLCIRLDPQDSFRNLLERVTREYYVALEYADHGRVSLERQHCLCNTSFNWRVGFDTTAIPVEPRSPREQTGDDLVAIPFQITSPMLDIEWTDDPDLFDGEPGIQLTEGPSGIEGTVAYRPDLFSGDLMEDLCSDFVRLTRALAEDPDYRIVSVSRRVRPTG